MPLFERPPLETLAQAKDRWTPLYLEHGRLEVDDSSVKWIGVLPGVGNDGESASFDPDPGNNAAVAKGSFAGEVFCGLGNLELVLLVPMGVWLARRRRTWR